jgi:hypothetical protein
MLEMSAAAGTSEEASSLCPHRIGILTEQDGEIMPVRFPVLSVIAAALVAMPDLAAAQGGPFCLKSALGALSCSYHSMILCEQAKQPNSRDQCIPRFQADETTGSSAAPLGNPPQPATRTPAVNSAPVR